MPSDIRSSDIRAISGGLPNEFCFARELSLTKRGSASWMEANRPNGSGDSGMTGESKLRCMVGGPKGGYMASCSSSSLRRRVSSDIPPVVFGAAFIGYGISLPTPFIVRRGGPGGEDGSLGAKPPSDPASEKGDGVRVIEYGTAGHCGTGSSCIIDTAGFIDTPEMLALRRVAVLEDAERRLGGCGTGDPAFGTDKDAP